MVVLVGTAWPRETQRVHVEGRDTRLAHGIHGVLVEQLVALGKRCNNKKTDDDNQAYRQTINQSVKQTVIKSVATQRQK